MQTLTQPDPKWKAYGDLLKYADPEAIDFKAIAKKHGITSQAVGSYFRNLKGGPNAYNDLLKQGYEASVARAE